MIHLHKPINALKINIIHALNLENSHYTCISPWIYKIDDKQQWVVVSLALNSSCLFGTSDMCIICHYWYENSLSSLQMDFEACIIVVSTDGNCYMDHWTHYWYTLWYVGVLFMLFVNNNKDFSWPGVLYIWYVKTKATNKVHQGVVHLVEGSDFHFKGFRTQRHCL